MTDPRDTIAATPTAATGGDSRSVLPYVRWMEAQGIPMYTGHYVEDLRTLPLAHWRGRECQAAFLRFVGQEGVSEARVTEIPGQTLRPLKFTLDEVVYVIDGRGLTTVWAAEGAQPTTFEWEKRSMFLLPRGSTHQFSNTQGDKPARLLQRNFLPLAMSLIPNPAFFFDSPALSSAALAGDGANFYSEARVVKSNDSAGRPGWMEWYGNFFPDMLAWDRLAPYRGRGAGGHSVSINFSGSELSARMSIFPVGTYKKAHRHGPGRVIVIPGGDGYSVMWEEGGERVVVPWHEGSVFSPPNRWFHQHFNTGDIPARYLRPVSSGALPQFSGRSEKVEDRAKDQIEYIDEDPWIRRHFEQELAKKGLKSLMPEEAYSNSDYEWDYGADD